MGMAGGLGDMGIDTSSFKPPQQQEQEPQGFLNAIGPEPFFALASALLTPQYQGGGFGPAMGAFGQALSESSQKSQRRQQIQDFAKDLTPSERKRFLMLPQNLQDQIIASTFGGDGDDPSMRSQKGDWVMLPDGRKVFTEFRPNQGLVYRDNGQVIPLPPGVGPITASQGGYLNANQYLDLKRKLQEGQNSLKAIEVYAKQAGGLPQGYQRWANDFVAKWKTFLNKQGLTQDQFDQLEAPAKQQALLGMLRTTIVGPGVMTEYDALRIIQAMGGNPSSVLQNPEVMVSILSNLYARKYQEVMVDQRDYERNAPAFGETPTPMPLSPNIPDFPGTQQTQGDEPPGNFPKVAGPQDPAFLNLPPGAYFYDHRGNLRRKGG